MPGLARASDWMLDWLEWDTADDDDFLPSPSIVADQSASGLMQK
jgi:hypothetical protein